MDTPHVISVSIWGLNTFEKRITIYDWLCDIKADIVFFKKYILFKEWV